MLSQKLANAEKDAKQLRREKELSKAQHQKDAYTADLMSLLEKKLNAIALETQSGLNEKLEVTLPQLVTKGLEQNSSLSKKVHDQTVELAARATQLDELNQKIIGLTGQPQHGLATPMQTPNKRPRISDDVSYLEKHVYKNACELLVTDLRSIHPEIDDKSGMTAEFIVASLVPLLADYATRKNFLNFMLLADVNAPMCAEGIRAHGHNNEKVREGHCFCTERQQCLRIQRQTENFREIKLQLVDIQSTEQGDD